MGMDASFGLGGGRALRAAEGDAAAIPLMAPAAEPACRLVPGTTRFAAACRERDHRSYLYRAVKRSFDIVFSLCVIIVGLVPGLVLCLAIAVETEGSPIYTQLRVGRGGRLFKIYKFRTMVADGDDLGKYLSPEQVEEWERERKVGDDPRVTRLGRILRSASIDEFPQFVNVLKGDMSLIGPRAITIEELGWFEPGEALVLLSVPQGITGAWQTGLRNDARFENGERQEIELEYALHAGLRRDFGIFLSTFGTMFGKGRTGR